MVRKKESKLCSDCNEIIFGVSAMRSHRRTFHKRNRRLEWANLSAEARRARISGFSTRHRVSFDEVNQPVSTNLETEEVEDQNTLDMYAVSNGDKNEHSINFSSIEHDSEDSSIDLPLEVGVNINRECESKLGVQRTGLIDEIICLKCKAALPHTSTCGNTGLLLFQRDLLNLFSTDPAFYLIKDFIYKWVHHSMENESTSGRILHPEGHVLSVGEALTTFFSSASDQTAPLNRPNRPECSCVSVL